MDNREMKVYKYKSPREEKERLALSRLQSIQEVKDQKLLTGWVHGKRATDLEERFARGLMSMKLEFWFQVPFSTKLSVPGHEKVVDFVVEDGFRYPVEVDGPIWHTIGTERGKDDVREILLNEVFRSIGYMPLQRVAWWRLESQAMANEVVRNIFGVGSQELRVANYK
jgi:hypothetical protein